MFAYSISHSFAGTILSGKNTSSFVSKQHSHTSRFAPAFRVCGYLHTRYSVTPQRRRETSPRPTKWCAVLSALRHLAQCEKNNRMNGRCTPKLFRSFIIRRTLFVNFRKLCSPGGVKGTMSPCGGSGAEAPDVPHCRAAEAPENVPAIFRSRLIFSPLYGMINPYFPIRNGRGLIFCGFIMIPGTSNAVSRRGRCRAARR